MGAMELRPVVGPCGVEGFECNGAVGLWGGPLKQKRERGVREWERESERVREWQRESERMGEREARMENKPGRWRKTRRRKKKCNGTSYYPVSPLDS
ncbi:hypothetical protein EJ06DRAFT_284587 [Trichodelitschia bisporula]|uniref:Uncharacterized protein n=1 Tax=Trichodelitschia bisporula TaxID=703511 RepID=A0A6G1I5Y7_9PEZI|nr:hypothetical protein EJ06DRAFT_284587 [Trichodelitschia bisporula]